MKRRLTAFIGMIILAVILVSAPSLTVMAANASVSVGSASVNAGSSVSVNITVNCDDTLGVLGLNVSYDQSILQLNAVSGMEWHGGSLLLWDDANSSSVTATLNFTGLAEGTSAVSVTSGECYAFDETPLSFTGSGSVTVEAPAAPAPDPAPGNNDQPDTPAEQPAETQRETEAPVNEALVVEIDGVTWYIAEEITASSLPAGFEAVDYSYGSEGIQIEAGKAKQADVYLLRLIDSEGENGSFWLYDPETGEFTRPVMILDSYMVVPLNDESIVPEGFAVTQIGVNVPEDEEPETEESGTDEADDVSGEDAPLLRGDIIQAWKAGNGTDDAFALVYVLNPQGELGFYRYDSKELTMQRYVREILEPESEPETEPESETEPETESETEAETEAASAEQTGLIGFLENNRWLTLILGLLALVFLVLLIVFAARYAAMKRELYGDRKTIGPDDESDIYMSGDPDDDLPAGDLPSGDLTDGDLPEDGLPEADIPAEDAAEGAAGSATADAAPETAAATAAPQSAPKQAPDFALPENMSGAKGFINELENMEKRLMEDGPGDVSGN